MAEKKKNERKKKTFSLFLFSQKDRTLITGSSLAVSVQHTTLVKLRRGSGTRGGRPALLGAPRWQVWGQEGSSHRLRSPHHCPQGWTLGTHGTTRDTELPVQVCWAGTGQGGNVDLPAAKPSVVHSAGGLSTRQQKMRLENQFRGEILAPSKAGPPHLPTQALCRQWGPERWKRP